MKRADVVDSSPPADHQRCYMFFIPLHPFICSHQGCILAYGSQALGVTFLKGAPPQKKTVAFLTAIVCLHVSQTLTISNSCCDR